jgi:hypothetical protein
MKWIGVIVLAVVGILALIVGVDYLTTSIHHLPSFLGGKRHTKGHYQKRGDALIAIGVVALGGAGYWAYRIRHSAAAGETPAESTVAQEATPGTDTLLSGPTPQPPTDG